MKKKLLLSLLVVAMLLQTTVLAAQQPVKITLNGTEIKSDANPVIKNDRTFVPVRLITEKLGYDVKWNEGKKEVSIKKGSDTVLLWIDKKDAEVNGKTETLDAAPFISEERTMVPLRFIGESFGLKVDWNGTTRTVTLESKKNKSILDGIDLTGLNAEEKAYAEAFDASQGEISYLLAEFRSYAFENFNKHSKEELREILTTLSFQINTEVGKAKELIAPERFKGTQNLYALTVDKLPAITEEYKAAFLMDDKTAANNLVSKLSEYSVIATQTVESIKAEAKGEKYVPSDDIKNYNDLKGDSLLNDPSLSNLLDQLGK